MNGNGQPQIPRIDLDAEDKYVLVRIPKGTKELIVIVNQQATTFVEAAMMLNSAMSFCLAQEMALNPPEHGKIINPFAAPTVLKG